MKKFNYCIKPKFENDETPVDMLFFKRTPESWVKWKNETKILVKIIGFSIE